MTAAPCAGHALAYDQDTGFGLVQALGQVKLPVLSRSATAPTARPGDTVVFAAAGGKRHSIAAKIAGRQEFAGYWEYLLDDAIFTLPAHPFWGGAARCSDEDGHADRHRHASSCNRAAKAPSGRT